MSEGFLNFGFILLSLFLIALIGVQGLRRTVPFISVRNLFLAGFIVFQLVSASVVLTTQDFDLFRVSDLPRAASILLMLCVLFILIFLIATRWRFPAEFLLRRIPSRGSAPNFVSLAVLSGMALATGILFKNILIYVPVFGVLSNIIGSGLLAAAVGLAAWAVAPRMLNPVALALFFGVLLVAAISAMHLSYGRRDLLTVLLAAIWGAYHGHWRHLGRTREMAMLFLICFGAIFLLAAVTVTRSKQIGGAEMLNRIASVRGEQLEYGLAATFSGQLTARNSLWVIEHFPEPYDYKPFDTLLYTIVHPIPRAIWEGKPSGLGWEMTNEYAKIGYAGFTVGPGVIGHIWADNPWLSLVPYAILFAALCRTMDEIVLRRPYNPFIVVAFGAALGQVIAIPRGDVGLFLFRTFSAVFFTLVAMVIVTKFLRLFGWTAEFDVAPDDLETYEAWPDEYALDHAADDQWRYEGHEADDRY